MTNSITTRTAKLVATGVLTVGIAATFFGAGIANAQGTVTQDGNKVVPGTTAQPFTLKSNGTVAGHHHSSVLG